jgi:HSP20 family protein
MSALTLSRKSLLPSWTSDLFDTGKLFSPMLDFNGNFPALDFASRFPTVNVIENDKDFKLEMAVPGMEKKDFRIHVENDMLTVSSEKKEETNEKKENYTRREFSFSSFSRSFRLPENCLPDKIDAKYEDGILKLVLPKKEVTLSKSVKEIKIS